MYCSTCGATVEENSQFCSVCGAQITNVQNQGNNFPYTDILYEPSNDQYEKYEETGRLIEDDFTPVRDNIFGGVLVDNSQQQAHAQQNYNNGYQNVQNASAFQNSQQYAQQNQQSYVNNSQPLDEKTFYNQFTAKATKGWVTALIVVCFVTGISSIGLLAMGSILSIADMLVYLIFGILLIVKKRWYFPLVVTVYGGIFSLITIATSGSPVGIFAVVAGIISITKLKKINDAYKQYQVSGVLPQNQI